MHTILQPEGWAKPVGYANGIAARGRQVFVGGQVGWTGRVPSSRPTIWSARCARRLLNVVADACRGRRRAAST